MNTVKSSAFSTLIFVIVSCLSTSEAVAQAAQCSDIFSHSKKFFIGGEKFYYTETISDSGQSTIVKLNNNRILRLFRKSKDPFISAKRFVQGHEVMAKNGVQNRAKILDKGSDWVIQEFIDVKFTLDYFIFHSEQLMFADPKAFNEMIVELSAFGRQTARFEDLGDFHSGQLAWDGKKWILLDWNHQHYFAQRTSKSTLFDGMESPSLFIKSMFQQLSSDIIEVRKRSP